MLNGVVKWFSDEKGYGFIESEGKEYFVHFREIAGEGRKTLVNGQKVEFLAEKNEKGMKATKVHALDS